MKDKQTINITIDDLINGNLRDMEFTAQFAVYRQAVKSLAEQLKRKTQECEKWKKLAETEQLQEELAIRIQENEEGREINTELKAENEKLKVWESITPLKTKMLIKALTEIKDAIGDRNKEGEAFCDDRLYKIEQILQKISEVEDVN